MIIGLVFLLEERPRAMRIESHFSNWSISFCFKLYQTDAFDNILLIRSAFLSVVNTWKKYWPNQFSSMIEQISFIADIPLATRAVILCLFDPWWLNDI